jgi:hypothetical protein
VGPKAGLDAVVRRKIPILYRDSNVYVRIILKWIIEK